jgi:hypothetical protein
MAVRSQYVESVASENAAAIIARLGTRLADVTRTIYNTLTTEIPELRGDPQVLELLAKLPSGYASMVCLAYFPPLWRRVMDRRVLEHYGGDITKANLHPAKREKLLARHGAVPLVL